MVTFIYITLFLTLWHFFYEGVLAPSLRHGLRYDFFRMRDELRKLKIQGLSAKDEEVYEFLDSSICEIISSMHFINIGNYFKLKNEYNRNKGSKEAMKKMFEFIGSSDNPALKEIDHEMNKYASKILLINSGGWVIYLIPLLVIGLIISAIFTRIGKIKSEIFKVASRLVYSRDKINDDQSVVSLGSIA